MERRRHLPAGLGRPLPAGVIGADVLVQHTGTIPAGPATRIDAAHALERDALRELGDLAARRGVTLAIENVFIESPAEYTAHPARLGAELSAIDHPHVCGTLDFSHAAIHCRYLGLDLGEAVRAFAPRVRHLHVHDSFGLPATFEGYTESENIAFGLGDLHLPLGWGELDWEGLTGDLPIGRDTVLMLEIRRAHWSELERSIEQARHLAARLDRMVTAAE